MNITFQLSLYLFIGVLVLGNGISASRPTFSNLLDNLPNIPAPLDFLAQLLNVTVSKITEIATEFTFNNETLLGEDIRIILYEKHGSFRNYTTNDNIPVNSSQDIKIIIHGWKSKGSEEWVKDIALSYHKIGIKNILSVDWHPLAKKDYLTAARATKKVGEIVGGFIFHKILKNNTADLKNIHLIGHSLGAQTSGFTGKRVTELSNGKLIGRITGLDAAAPFFEYPIKLPSSLRISSQDARIVEGFHTNAGFLGFLSAFGQQDYYISFGGPIQPGCLQGVDVVEAFTCSHSRSHHVFNKSIASKNYFATSCGSPLLAFANLCKDNPIVIMGEHNNGTETDGEFFVAIDNNGDPVADRNERGISAFFSKFLP